MLDVLKQLAVCMSEVMDEYELTKQGREQAQRENRKIGEEIINDARAKAEDVYAASVMYTDEALRRILDIMDEANESVKAVYDSMGEKLANERKLVSGDKLELKSLLQDLKDTDKYMGIIEERNKKIAKEKKWKGEGTEPSPYAAVKPEIKINRFPYIQRLWGNASFVMRRSISFLNGNLDGVTRHLKFLSGCGDSGGFRLWGIC